MRVHILGPNLGDIDHTFHVHAEGCPDVQRSRMYRHPEFEWDRNTAYEVDSMRDVVEFCYSDHMGDCLDDDPWSSWEPYADDFKVFPCANALLT